jgi:hypothetical protein
MASENDDDESSSSSDGGGGGSLPAKTPSARDRGIYSRPSGAIERGSGFFVPGLEGSRIRLAFGLVVLAVDAATIATSGTTGWDDWGQVVSESLAAFYGVLLLLQGSIEMGIEGRGEGAVVVGDGGEDGEDDGGDTVAGAEGDGGGEEYGGGASGGGGGDDGLGPVRRAARAIVALTPATEFRFVAEDYGVVYSIGSAGVSDAAASADDERRFATLALDAVSSGSRGGERVALPADHPSSAGLLPQVATRAVLVQRAGDYRGSRACVVIGSDKPLPAFTRNDLRWIGRLAGYCDLMTMREKVSGKLG